MASSSSSSSSSTTVLLLNVAALAIYGYSLYAMNSKRLREGMSAIMPAKLNVYGQLRFLTYQCLLIQILNALLHVLAHFFKSLRKVRDIVFTTLAYPVGSIVVYTFWAVWFIVGRELILPARMDEFFPPWLNHATHTLMAPLNILMSLLAYHKYPRNGVSLTILYTGLYTALLHLIKYQTGLFVYPYLDEMNERVRLAYFACTGLFSYLMYKSGQYLTHVAHSSANVRPTPRVATTTVNRKQKLR